jgi:hypothetical protein
MTRVEVLNADADPWADVLFFPRSAPVRSADLSALREIVFPARCDGREYNRLFRSGSDVQCMPAMPSFVAGTGWKECRLPLAAFFSADMLTIPGIALVAGLAADESRLDRDKVELR